MASRKPAKESGLVSACLEYLKLRRIPAWRQNSGAVVVESKGKRRFVRFNGAPGCSDILGVFPPKGRLLAVEVKMPGNKPTEAQRAFLDMVIAAGGIGLVIYSVGELHAALEGES